MAQPSRQPTASRSVPHCPRCPDVVATCTLHTDYVQYYRCPECGYIWNEPHPLVS